jgi:hypothetical protein
MIIPSAKWTDFAGIRKPENWLSTFHVPPNSVRLPEEKRTIAHSAGIPAKNWSKVYAIIIMALAANLLPLRCESLVRCLPPFAPFTLAHLMDALKGICEALNERASLISLARLRIP